MNETSKGSVEPSRGTHLANPLINHHHEDFHLEHIEHLHHEHDEDPRYSYFARGLHENPGFNLLEGEERFRSDLLVALNSLNARDLRVMKHLMLSRMNKGVRLITYVFAPILMKEALFVWKNAPSLQRLQNVAGAYERYRQAVEKNLQTNSEKRQNLKSEAEAYIIKQVKASQGVNLLGELNAAIDYADHQDRFSPLVRTSLARGDGSNQEQFDHAWSNLGKNLEQHSNRMLDGGIELIAARLANTIQGASSLFIKTAMAAIKA